MHGSDTESSEIAILHHNLALLFRAQGKLTEAETMLQKSLIMNYSIHGQDSEDINIAKSLNQLGSTLLSQGNLLEAEIICRKSLNMEYSIHGRDSLHVDIANWKRAPCPRKAWGCQNIVSEITGHELFNLPPEWSTSRYRTFALLTWTGAQSGRKT